MLQALLAAAVPAVIGGAFSAFGASKANKKAEAASQKQMDFQERMSNTQYQRAMADMKKAGLNPMLAYKQGGAGTPGGSTFSPVNVGAAAVTGATAGASSALSAIRQRAEIKSIEATTIKTGQDTRTSNMSLELMRAQAFVELQKQSYIGEQRHLLQQQGIMNEAAVHSAKSASSILKTSGGRAASRLGRLFRELNPFMRTLPSVGR